MSENQVQKTLKYKIVKSQRDAYPFRCSQTVYLYMGKYTEGRKKGMLLAISIIAASLICGLITGEVVFDTLICVLAFGSFLIHINLLSIIAHDTEGYQGSKSQMKEKYRQLQTFAGPTLTMARYFELYFPFCLILAIPNMVLKVLLPVLFIWFCIHIRICCEFLHPSSSKEIRKKIKIKAWRDHLFICGLAFYFSLQTDFTVKVFSKLQILLPALLIGVCISFYNKSCKRFHKVHKAITRTPEFDILSLVDYMEIIPRELSLSEYKAILDKEDNALREKLYNCPRKSWGRDKLIEQRSEIWYAIQMLDDLILFEKKRCRRVNIKLDKLCTIQQGKQRIHAAMTPEMENDVKNIKKEMERTRHIENMRRNLEYERQRREKERILQEEQEKRLKEKREKERLEELQRRMEREGSHTVAKEDQVKIRKMDSEKYNVDIKESVKLSRGRGRS